MLKGTKSTTLNYSSEIDGKTVVYMTAQIPESGKSNCNKIIQDKELYEANKSECRKDMAAFDEMLWKMEDQRNEDTSGGVTNETEK